MTDLVLVTGATGLTGGYTAEILTQQGIPVRALVHKEDERAQKLRMMGVDVVIGDLLNLNDARRALDGVSTAYFIYPIAPGIIDATAYFAQAAKEAGTKAVVNMSQISARRDSKSNAARDHWMAERVFDWSGLEMTHLRPTYFAEWLLYPHFLQTIRDNSLIVLPFGEGRHAPITARDQARLIAAILADPKPHAGKTYPLHGPEEMSQHQVAKIVGDVLGKRVEYQPITIEQFRGQLTQAGIPSFLVQHLCEVALDYQNGIFEGEDTVIKAVTGQAPMTVQAFVEAHRQEYQSTK